MARQYYAGMGARERARLDIERGDLGSARRRLMSLAQTKQYPEDVCEEIARLCVRMHDPIEAGRGTTSANQRMPRPPGASRRLRRGMGVNFDEYWERSHDS